MIIKKPTQMSRLFYLKLVGERGLLAFYPFYFLQKAKLRAIILLVGNKMNIYPFETPIY